MHKHGLEGGSEPRALVGGGGAPGAPHHFLCDAVHIKARHDHLVDHGVERGWVGLVLLVVRFQIRKQLIDGRL